MEPSSTSRRTGERPAGYLELVRENRTFRRLWLGDVVSLAGDWFTTISLFSLLLERTGRGEAVGYALIARFLPALLFGPLAGVVADRFSRKAIMVAADLGRALVVVGYLFVRGPEDAPLAYALSFAQLTLAAFFDPAQQATVGTVVSRREIVAANALQGITWSAMLAVGALAGGLFAQAFGRDAAFLVNSATYLASAVLIGSAAIPRGQPRPAPATLTAALGLDSMAEGLRCFASQPRVRRVIVAKAGWGLAGGGAILLYNVFGERVFPVGVGAATGIGILYAARGVGALVGPLLARRFSGDSEPALERAIGLAYVLMAGAWALFAGAPWLPLAAVALVLAHSGASTIWTFSTSLVNLRVPDELRGRAFAADMALHTLALTVSTFATGYALDHLGLSPRVVMGALAAMGLVPIAGWWLAGREPAPAPSPR